MKEKFQVTKPIRKDKYGVEIEQEYAIDILGYSTVGKYDSKLYNSILDSIFDSLEISRKDLRKNIGSLSEEEMVKLRVDQPEFGRVLEEVQDFIIKTHKKYGGVR